MEADSRTDLQSTSFETSQSVVEVASSPRKKYSLLIGVAITITLILAVVLFFFNKKSNKQITMASPTESELSGLSVVYSYRSYSTKTQSWSDRKAFIANLTNTQKVQVNPDTFADTFLPSGKRFVRTTPTSIATSNDFDPTSFNTIVDISSRDGVYPYIDFNWSEDEQKLAYELRNKNDIQYYTANFDGTNKKLVATIPLTGGRFLGYDFANDVVYRTQNRFGTLETETLVALDTATNQLREIITLPIDTEITLAPDYTKAYFSEDRKIITELDLNDLQRKIFFDISPLSISEPVERLSMRFFPDQSYAFITVSFDSSPSLKYLLKHDNGEIDNTYNSEVFRGLWLWSISPDSRYLYFLSNGSIKSENSFYGKRNCIWDRVEKRLIPFFNCKWGPDGFINEGVGEEIMITGWIRRAESLQMVHNQLPSPTAAIKYIKPDDGLDVYTRTRNIVRKSNLSALIRAIEAYVKANKRLPQGITATVRPIAKSGADICSALVPQFIGALPRDPDQNFDPNNEYARGGYVTDCDGDYVTGFMIVNESDRVTLSAPLTEQTAIISETLSLPLAE